MSGFPDAPVRSVKVSRGYARESFRQFAAFAREAPSSNSGKCQCCSCRRQPSHQSPGWVDNLVGVEYASFIMVFCMFWLWRTQIMQQHPFYLKIPVFARIITKFQGVMFWKAPLADPGRQLWIDRSDGKAEDDLHVSRLSERGRQSSWLHHGVIVPSVEKRLPYVGGKVRAEELVWYKS